MHYFSRKTLCPVVPANYIDQMPYISYEESSRQKKMSELIDTIWKGPKSSSSPEKQVESVRGDDETVKDNSDAKDGVAEGDPKKTGSTTEEAEQMVAKPDTDIGYAIWLKPPPLKC